MSDIDQERMEAMAEQFPTNQFHRRIDKTAREHDIDHETAVLMDMMNCFSWVQQNIDVPEGDEEEWTVEELTMVDDYETAMESTKRLMLHLK